jgi:hypothetical protein
MGETPWREAVKLVKPYVVKIYTPRGSGTGFLCAYAEDKKLCGIATAAHVIDESHYWEEPMRIRHHDSKKTKLLRASDRVIWIDSNLDTAVILFHKGGLPFPDKILPFISEGKHLVVGEEIGWVGFPAVSPQNLCFFTGRNSCWLNDSRTYLVDGVAINGVSGGPAFSASLNGVKVIGSVSAYLPNRSGSTPGLAMISDVDQFLKVIKEIKDWEEAKKKETPPSEPIEQKQDKNGQGGTTAKTSASRQGLL